MRKLFSTSLIYLAVSGVTGFSLNNPVFAGPVPVIQTPSSTINPTTYNSFSQPTDPASTQAISTLSSALNADTFPNLIVEMAGLGFGQQGQQVVNAWQNYLNAPSLETLDRVAAAFNNLINEAAFNGIDIATLRANSPTFVAAEAALRKLVPNSITAAGG